MHKLLLDFISAGLFALGLTSEQISQKIGIIARGVRNYVLSKEKELGIFIG